MVWGIMFKTPILIFTEGDFEEYIKSLSKPARKNYKATMKLNPDTVYKKIPYDRGLMEGFMKLWENQLIRGERRKWAFDGGYLDNLHEETKLHCFAAYIGSECVSAHFVEQHDDYIECHPPMYNKERYSKMYMAKFMWFNAIKWAFETEGVEWFDMGGGHRGTWRDVIRNRDEHPITKYKWMYVPEEVKKNPDKQPEYKVLWTPSKKSLVN